MVLVRCLGGCLAILELGLSCDVVASCNAIDGFTHLPRDARSARRKDLKCRSLSRFASLNIMIAPVLVNVTP